MHLMHFDASGCSWMHLDSLGCIWMHLYASGCIWLRSACDLMRPDASWIRVSGRVRTWLDAFRCIQGARSVSDGYVWIYMDMYGRVWLPLGMFGCVWMCLDVSGCVWTHLDVFGFSWVRLLVSMLRTRAEAKGPVYSWMDGMRLEALDAFGFFRMSLSDDEDARRCQRTRLAG